MSGLQTAFYIIAIIFMGVIFIMLAALVVIAIKIRQKINKIHDNIESRINSVTAIAEKGGELVGAAGSKVIRKARRTLRKR